MEKINKIKSDYFYKDNTVKFENSDVFFIKFKPFAAKFKNNNVYSIEVWSSYSVVFYSKAAYSGKIPIGRINSIGIPIEINEFTKEIENKLIDLNKKEL